MGKHSSSTMMDTPQTQFSLGLLYSPVSSVPFQYFRDQIATHNKPLQCNNFFTGAKGADRGFQRSRFIKGLMYFGLMMYWKNVFNFGRRK